MLKLLLTLLLPLPLLAQPAPADSARARRIAAVRPVLDKIYADFAASKHVPGLAYGLVVDGRLAYSNALGYGNLTTKTLATPRTVFRIASMSKSFVALAVLRLRDEGRLRLDEPAAKYLPELQRHPPAGFDTPPITIRQLLSHAAGLPEDNPWGDRQMGRADADLDALVGRGLPLATAPGEAYQYSNLGYALLGRIIGRITGQPFQAYVSAHLLRPLGMSHTYWDYRQVPPALLAAGYRRTADAWQPEPLLPNGESWAALGGLLTTVEDFSKYLVFLADAWPARLGPDAGPVRRSSVREAQQPWAFSNLNAGYRYPSGRACALVSSYGYGLRVSQDCAGRRYVGHGGGLPGFGSHWWLLPDYGVAVVALTNQTYAGPTAANFAALDTLLALARLRPRPVTASAVLRQRKEQLAKLLPGWEAVDKQLFAGNFFLDEDLASRRQTAQTLFAQVGRVLNVGELEPDDALRGRFRLRGERGSVEVFFTLSPETPARVQQLDLRLVR